MTSLSSPGNLSAWLLACRPATLTAAVSPVAVGTAVAAHQGNVLPFPALATLLGAMLLQVGSNFANDVFDYEKGADTQERLGPTRAVQAGLVTPEAMKKGLLWVLGLALLVGVYLAFVAGPVIIVLGLLAIAAAIAYTGGPFPLGYHGLGDVFVMIFFGFVAVCGTAFVHLGDIPTLALLASLPPGALTTNILVINNVRDRHTDTRAGKKTLAVRLGRRAAELQYQALAATAYLVPLVLLWFGGWGPAILLPYLTLPLALRNIDRLKKDEGQTLNRTLVASAQLAFFHSALFAAGIFLDGHV